MKVNWRYFTQNVFVICFGTTLISLLVACNSSTPTPNGPSNYSFSKINCYVRYIAQNRELQADMTFRTDSTQTIDSIVALNGIPMPLKKRPIVGLQYRLLKNSTHFDQDYTFSYFEKDGKKVELSIGLNDFEDFKVASDGVSKTKGGLLKWKGAPLEGNDGLVLIFTDSEGNTFSINHTGVSKGNKFEIISDHANRLALGTATIEATRKKTMVYEENKTVKMLTIEYYNRPIKFEVKE